MKIIKTLSLLVLAGLFLAPQLQARESQDWAQRKARLFAWNVLGIMLFGTDRPTQESTNSNTLEREEPTIEVTVNVRRLRHESIDEPLDSDRDLTEPSPGTKVSVSIQDEDDRYISWADGTTDENGDVTISAPNPGSAGVRIFVHADAGLNFLGDSETRTLNPDTTSVDIDLIMNPRF